MGMVFYLVVCIASLWHLPMTGMEAVAVSPSTIHSLALQLPHPLAASVQAHWIQCLLPCASHGLPMFVTELICWSNMYDTLTSWQCYTDVTLMSLQWHMDITQKTHWHQVNGIHTSHSQYKMFQCWCAKDTVMSECYPTDNRLCQCFHGHRWCYWERLCQHCFAKTGLCIRALLHQP